MPKLETYSPSCNKDYFQKFFSEKYGISHLEEDYFRYIDYDSVFVFSREEWDEFLSIVEKVNAVFIKAYDVSQQEIEQNLPEFGPLLKYFPRHFSVKDFFLARYDVIIDSKDGNYKFLETNSNTPGLITESYHLAKHLCPPELYNPADSFVQHIQSVFSPFHEKKLGILLSHSFDDEDFIMANDYKDMLSDIFGAENIVISDIYESHIIGDSHFTMKGVPIDVILNFFPFEFMLTDVDFAVDFFKLVESKKVIIRNPLSSMLLQDKRIFAIIWENLELFTKEEQETIKKHIPMTLRKEPERSEGWIAKWRFGRYGRQIYLDSFATNIDKVDEFIFQERIYPKSCDDTGNFLVLGAFSNFQTGISVCARKQKKLTTADEDSKVTLSYIRN